MSKSIFVSFVLCVLSSSIGFAKNKFNYRNASLVLQFPQGPAPTANPLLYYGGPVISKVEVFAGLWSDRVSEDVKANIADLYQSYVSSSHMDWLNEYATNIKAVDGRDGTNQTIGRGSFTGLKIFTPVQSAKKITDEQIQEEIVKQIEAGQFPVPNSNTLYMLHFPSDIQITIEGMFSCFSFGGYHSGFKSQKYGDIFYGVMPECNIFGGSDFSSISVVSSHELNEAVTDPYPTPGSSPAYPQAWNAKDGNEIADLCQSGSSTLKGQKAEYEISNEWSNSRKQCYGGQ